MAKWTLFHGSGKPGGAKSAGPSAPGPATPAVDEGAPVDATAHPVDAGIPPSGVPSPATDVADTAVSAPPVDATGADPAELDATQPMDIHVIPPAAPPSSAPSFAPAPPGPAAAPRGPATPPRGPATARTGPGKTKKKSRGPLVAVIAVTAVVLLIAGSAVGGGFFFQSHAKPGTELSGTSVTGFSEADVRALATTLIGDYKATLGLGGRQVEAQPAEMGVTFDVDATVARVMDAGSELSWIDRYNPFTPKPVPLAMTVDSGKLQAYLNQTFIDDSQRAVTATTKFDAEKKQFVVVPGQSGIQADAATVARQLAEGAGLTAALDVPTVAEIQPVSDAAAQQAVDEANRHLGMKYVVKAGDESYTIPATTLAGWTTFTEDAEAGTLVAGVDNAKVTAELPGILAKKLTTAMVTKQILIGPDGKPMVTKRAGKNGTKIKDPAAATTQVIDALATGKGINLTVDVVTDKFTTENVKMDDKYLKPNGERWIEINRTTFRLTRWEGTTKIDQYPVVIGVPSLPTPTGVWEVWWKLPLQDMSGPGYYVHNVPWVAYFAGDNALHGNYWVDSYGRAMTHGCVGLYPPIAEKVYKWLDVGTMVIVHD